MNRFYTIYITFFIQIKFVTKIFNFHAKKMAVASLDADFDSKSNAATAKCPAVKLKIIAYFLDLQNFKKICAFYSYHLIRLSHMTKVTSINIFLLLNPFLHTKASFYIVYKQGKPVKTNGHHPDT